MILQPVTSSDRITNTGFSSALVACPAVLQMAGPALPPAGGMYAYAFERAKQAVAMEAFVRGYFASLN